MQSLPYAPSKRRILTMYTKFHFFVWLLCLSTITIAHGLVSTQEVAKTPGEMMAEMAKKGELYATPHQQHQLLEQLRGEWRTSTVVMGMEEEHGSANGNMILGGRFLEMKYRGVFMGVDLEGIFILGYDNYKHKYTAVFIDNLNTSTRIAEGTMDQTNTVLSLWGTMDEWLTDEHDIAVLYRFRIKSPSLIILEIHDLTISLGNTNVVEITFVKTK